RSSANARVVREFDQPAVCFGSVADNTKFKGRCQTASTPLDPYVSNAMFDFRRLP
ncbi:hypothetical protein LSAT2_017321, partial [Lamellibrachia satsuma]